MLITIITVCLNAENHIRKCIESIVGQDYTDIEYILIDGGSTDSTLKIIEFYKQKFSFIRYISEKDFGISDAFNKGIRMSKGDIVGIINSDDWLESNILNKISREFDKGDILHGNLQYWSNGQKGYLFVPNINGLMKDMTINHPTVFVKKHVYDTFGVFDLDFKYGMDYELLLRFYLGGVKFYHLNETIANMSLYGISDRAWFKGILESRRAKLKNGLNPTFSTIYMIFQIIRSFFSRYMQKIGLNWAVQYYRSIFSTMKKYKND